MQTRFYKGFAALLTILTLAACGSSTHTLISDLYPGLTNSPGSSDSISGPPGPVNVCSKLNFNGVIWDSSMSANEKTAIQIGLNISGSFEGPDGWGNLTNNFDGEGVSLGLLNQNLGTGSLQPLLIEMRDSNLVVLQRIFDSGRLQSLLGMLSQWQGANKKIQLQSLFAPLVGPPREPFSLLDEPIIELDSVNVSSVNQDSVTWAKKTLYTDGGKTFDSVWLKDLVALARDPAYVTIQIDAALDLHRFALTEEVRSGVNELRTYLLMFDINVQDGGMYSKDWTDYAAWLKSGAHNDTDRLNQLLQLRLRHVKPQYVSDVRSRKQAIIDGKGFVHGDNRSLEAEYCFDRMVSFP